MHRDRVPPRSIPSSTFLWRCGRNNWISAFSGCLYFASVACSDGSFSRNRTFNRSMFSERSSDKSGRVAVGCLQSSGSAVAATINCSGVRDHCCRVHVWLSSRNASLITSLPGVEPGLRPSQSRVHPPHSKDKMVFRSHRENDVRCQNIRDRG